MVDVITVVNELPPAIKAGWMIWIGWAAVQVIWYRRAHVAAMQAAMPRVVQPATPPPAPRRRPESRPVRRDAAAPVAALPAIDLSDIRAAAEGSSMEDEDAPQLAGSILGLDPRPSAN
jgi:hypothetical protein